MTTNHLEITENNVYQLLLYAQLLQMPQIILQCRSFIAQRIPQIPVQTNTERTVSSTIVRPIPNKVPQPQLWKPWLYSASLYHDWLSRLHSAASTSQDLQNQENTEPTINENQVNFEFSRLFSNQIN